MPNCKGSNYIYGQVSPPILLYKVPFLQEFDQKQIPPPFKDLG